MAPNLVKKLQLLRNKSNHHQHRLSAVLLLRGRPISFGVNDSKRTHPKIKRWSDVKTIHAEMSAIFRVKDTEILKNCTMVVYREDRYNNPANARPCSVCEAMLRDYGIKHIMYSTKDGWVEEELK